eukprot:1161319-Pelagomonas_calceolata.AAC.18
MRAASPSPCFVVLGCSCCCSFAVVAAFLFHSILASSEAARSCADAGLSTRRSPTYLSRKETPQGDSMPNLCMTGNVKI